MPPASRPVPSSLAHGLADRDTRAERAADSVAPAEATDKLTPMEQEYVTMICVQIPALGELRGLALAFEQMLRTHDANGLGPRLDAADRSEFRSFARGLTRDRDAVLGAILFRWSNGQAEGQVHRLKAIKRAMYGGQVQNRV